MEKIKRSEGPRWLLQNARQWGRDWRDTCREKGTEARFEWRQDGGHTREDLDEILLSMTQYHCAYCDGYPMQRRIPMTIDHFRPKKEYPLLAYQWPNLFPCCGNCQKRNYFDKKLLKPDQDSYNFDDYFEIDWVSGKLNPIEPDEDDPAAQARAVRAELFIRSFKLNHFGRPKDRIEQLKAFENLTLEERTTEIDRYSYRFLLERGTRIC